jgi:PAS domain-containing protein
VNDLVTLVRGPHYSIVDLVRDISIIKAENGAEPGPLDAVLAGCIDQTSRVHETAIETMQHGFCELLEGGVIGYANAALLKLAPDCEGKRLSEYFPKDRLLIQDAVSRGIGELTHQVTLEYAKRACPVFVTFGPGERPAQFAFVIDLTAAAAAERRAHDTAPFPILKLDTDHQITYANEQAGKLLGSTVAQLIGTAATQLAADSTARAALEQEFEKRRLGRISEYRLEVQPIDGVQSEPMLVRSFPNSDPDGRLASTLVTFSRIGPDEVGAKIREAMATSPESRVLFKTVVEALRPLVTFDMAALWLYTSGREFSRLLYAEPSLEVDTLWFPVPEDFRGLPDEEQPFGTIKKTLSETRGGDTLSQEAVVKALEARGMQSWLALPIRDGDHDAVLALYNKRPDYFSEATAADLQRAGLAQAIQTVLRLRTKNETAFRFSLLQAMAQTRSDRDLAELVVEKLATFYGWQNVSIFKVNVAQGQFELLAQASGPVHGYRLPECYRQAIDCGFLGEAYRTGEITIVNDAKESPDKELFVVGSDLTRSELCFPIRSGDKVAQGSRNDIAWILNIEDHRPHAFKGPDQLAIRDLMSEVGISLLRMLDAALLEQVLEEVPQGVVITDLKGRILHYNRCAKDMVGEGAEGLQLNQFLVGDPLPATAVLQETSLPVDRTVTALDGHRTAVLISARVPRIQYDRLVVFMQDTRKLAWQTETREVMQALGDLAAETRVPLSLVSSYIRQMGRQSSSTAVVLADMASRAAAQLATVELGYSRVVDRVQREKPTELVSLKTVLTGLVEELSEALARRVRLLFAEKSEVKTDSERLVTALRKMLAYMLRLGEADIDVRVHRFERAVGLSMSQALSPVEDERNLAMARFALDVPGLMQFAGLSGGIFRHRRSLERETLRLILRGDE